MHDGWAVEDWETVLFSDETNTQTEPNGGNRKMWRNQGEKLSDFSITVSMKFPTSFII